MPHFPPITSAEWRQSLQIARDRRHGEKDRITKARIKYMDKKQIEKLIESLDARIAQFNDSQNDPNNINYAVMIALMQVRMAIEDASK